MGLRPLPWRSFYTCMYRWTSFQKRVSMWKNLNLCKMITPRIWLTGIFDLIKKNELDVAHIDFELWAKKK